MAANEESWIVAVEKMGGVVIGLELTAGDGGEAPGRLAAADHVHLTIGDLGKLDRAITVEELAYALGVSPAMIFSRANGGSIPCFRICGAIRFCPITVVKSMGLPSTISTASIWERLEQRSPALSAEALACIFHVHPQTLLKSADQGDIPCIRVGTRVTFYGPEVSGFSKGKKPAKSATAGVIPSDTISAKI